MKEAAVVMTAVWEVLRARDSKISVLARRSAKAKWGVDEVKYIFLGRVEFPWSFTHSCVHAGMLGCDEWLLAPPLFTRKPKRNSSSRAKHSSNG